MSGLDVDKELILEMATIITDTDLNVIEEGPNLVIHQSNIILDRMDEWNKKHHLASGLIDKVKQSSITEVQSENQTIEFIRRYCLEATSPLCGNSIGHDRQFLRKYMRKLHDYFHYRSIDVSSIKELVERWYPNGPKPLSKSEKHVAITDVRESIEELRFYRKHYFIP